MPEPVPAELRNLVERSLAPGVRLERAGKSSDRDAWWFNLMWRGRPFDLWIRDFWLHDQSRDLIASLAWIAAPAPEATLSGQRFWLRLKADDEKGDSVRYYFAVLKDLDDEEISAVVEITRTARQLLHNVAGPAKRTALEFEISSAIVVLKDHFEGLVPGGEISVDSNTVGAVTKRARPSDSAVRKYVGSKLYQAYQSSTSGLTLTFNRRDLDYLGISEEDFGRATSLVELEGWEVQGLTIQPGKAFLQRFESDLDQGSSAVGGGSGGEVPGVSGRTVFICHAEPDKTIANVLRDYLKAADHPIEVFVASHPESLPGGQEWWNGILANLRMAGIVLSIYSPRSKERPWLYFESGGAHLRGTLVIPLAVPPEPKGMPLPLGALQGYALDDVGDVRALVHQVGRTFGVRFSNAEETLHDRLRTEMQLLSTVAPFSASAPGAGETSWRDILKWVVGAGHLLRVSPVVPPVFGMATFEVVALKDERVGLRMVGSGHLVDIPPYAVIGVHEENGEYALRINGRLQWIDADNSWRFMPEAPDPSSPHGLARNVTMESTEVQDLIQKLRADGWQLEFQLENKATSRLSSDYQLVYGGDGRYLRVPDRPPSVMVKHR